MFTDVISNCSWLVLFSAILFFASFSLSLSLSCSDTYTYVHWIRYTYLLAFCMQAHALTLSILCLCFKRGKPKVIVPLMTAKCNGLADTDRTRPNSWMVDIPWVFITYWMSQTAFFKTTSLIRKTVLRRWNILYLLVNRLRSGYFGDSKDLW